MAYREIRVRPVVRYIVTDYSCDDEEFTSSSIAFGEFDNVSRANVVAYALAGAEKEMAGFIGSGPIVKPCKALKIEWGYSSDGVGHEYHLKLAASETGKLAEKS